MNVLIVSANQFPFSPCGPAYVAGAAREAGHAVEVFDRLFSIDPVRELKEILERFKPDVVGISIRTVAGKIRERKPPYSTIPFDSRILVKELTDCVKQTSGAAMVVGGPGFNYYGEAWLHDLDLDYGLRGECEFSFPLYLSLMDQGKDIHSIPGCVFRKEGGFSKVERQWIKNLDDTALPAYDLFDLDRYVEKKIAAGIFTKRGCAFACTYCPYTSLEGKQYRLKSPKRVVEEMQFIQKANSKLTIEFNDNSFNAPPNHADAICKEILNQGILAPWSTMNLKPIGITNSRLKLFKDSGCVFLNLAIETASEDMLKSMHKGFSVCEIKNALSCLATSGIPFSVSLMFGAPGETPETIEETLKVVDDFPNISWTSATVGINLWTDHQQLVSDLIQTGQLNKDADLFGEQNYISPDLPKEYMIDLIEQLKQRKNFMVQVNMPYAGFELESFFSFPDGK